MKKICFNFGMKNSDQINENIYDLPFLDSKKNSITLSDYRGKVILVVNVASKCGFTPQYEGLEKIYQAYKNKDFIIVGFPCNQFGAQEPGSISEIQQFCQINYGVSFPVMAKVDVNGAEAAPLFQHLKSEAPGILGTEAIKWNFTKFLIGKNGKVLSRYAPQTKPEDLSSDIEKALQDS